MANPPFRVATDASLSLPDGNLQVFVRLARRVALDAAARSRLAAPIRAWSSFGDAGGLAGAAHAPETSRLKTLIEAQLTGQANELVWAFEVANVDAGALVVLQNVLHHVHLLGTDIDSVALHGALVRTGRPVAGELPVDYEPYAFDVEYGMERAQVLVDVEFDQPLEPAQLAALERGWSAWEIVAGFGGFADETYPPGKASLAVEDALRVTSTGASANYDDVAIADAGFYCLVNLLQAIRARGARIAGVVIE
ncbi:MAG TPA: hypothetical protein VJR89_32365 [Polyangiales bacterium]|nr:hypothetical protein [Polyangiales bacterium]